MKLEERINAFALLGGIIRGTLSGETNDHSSGLNSLIFSQVTDNPWFTPENVRMALEAIGNELTYGNLIKWTADYPALLKENNPLNIGVVMAGNIPLAGFHDLLSVLISGNRIIAKTSSKDSTLINRIGNILSSINPDFRNLISFTDGVLKDFDMIIATGSDNSARYFEYYFGRYPHIIRKNRNSVAVLEGNETGVDLANLGIDVFSYFGLGCRNVSKVFLPCGYDINNMVMGWDSFSGVINHVRYANNYDFNKAVWMVNMEKFTDGGFVLLKESRELSSPVSAVFYEYYDSEENLKDKLALLKDKIQCITGYGYTPFGKSQFPELWDYADNADTLEFLLKKNQAILM